MCRQHTDLLLCPPVLSKPLIPQWPLRGVSAPLRHAQIKPNLQTHVACSRQSGRARVFLPRLTWVLYGHDCRLRWYFFFLKKENYSTCTT